MFLFSNSFRVTSRTIKGIQYVVFSYYGGDETVFDRIGDLIENSFQESTIDEITNESSVDSGIDTDKR